MNTSQVTAILRSPSLGMQHKHASINSKLFQYNVAQIITKLQG